MNKFKGERWNVLLYVPLKYLGKFIVSEKIDFVAWKYFQNLIQWCPVPFSPLVRVAVFELIPQHVDRRCTDHPVPICFNYLFLFECSLFSSVRTSGFSSDTVKLTVLTSKRIVGFCTFHEIYLKMKIKIKSALTIKVHFWSFRDERRLCCPPSQMCWL